MKWLDTKSGPRNTWIIVAQCENCGHKAEFTRVGYPWEDHHEDCDLNGSKEYAISVAQGENCPMCGETTEIEWWCTCLDCAADDLDLLPKPKTKKPEKYKAYQEEKMIPFKRLKPARFV